VATVSKTNQTQLEEQRGLTIRAATASKNVC